MDRRTFTRTLAGLMAASALPKSLQAQSALGNQAEFFKGLEQKLWLLGYLGTTETELHANIHIVSGRIPDDLRGNFYRNGPALHNLGQDRFRHWFDAPGMIQRPSFSEIGITPSRTTNRNGTQ